VYQKVNGRFRAIATTTPGQGLQVGTWSTAREVAIAVDRVTLYFEREDLPEVSGRGCRRLDLRPVRERHQPFPVRQGVVRSVTLSRFPGLCLQLSLVKPGFRRTFNLKTSKNVEV
jgi:hypothetical protein